MINDFILFSADTAMMKNLKNGKGEDKAKSCIVGEQDGKQRELPYQCDHLIFQLVIIYI